jgi:hypothetical protein
MQAVGMCLCARKGLRLVQRAGAGRNEQQPAGHPSCLVKQAKQSLVGMMMMMMMMMADERSK